jgi:hypothetical protein
MRQFSTPKLLLLLPALLLVLSGCSSSDPAEEPDLGSFTATLTGDVNQVLSGDAGLSVGARFIVSLGNGSVGSIPMYFGAITRPPAGTYQVVHNGGASDWAVAVYISPTQSYTGTSGTVKILSSTDALVTGELSFTAVRANNSSGDTIQVTGTFRAVAPQAL